MTPWKPSGLDTGHTFARDMEGRDHDSSPRVPQYPPQTPCPCGGMGVYAAHREVIYCSNARCGRSVPVHGPLNLEVAICAWNKDIALGSPSCEHSFDLLTPAKPGGVATYKCRKCGRTRP